MSGFICAGNIRGVIQGGRLLSTACGSPCYAAPEMIAGHKYRGPVADIWSIGVILFALVCGHLPFEDPNTSNLYRKILSGEYRTPKWISPEVKDLIRRILETDPNRRLTIPEVRQHPWCMMVPLSAIPRDDILSAEETEDARNEVMKRLVEMNLDPQAVLDAVSSRTCNAFSAMYYLLMQKEAARSRLTKKASSTSRPETSHPTELVVGGGAHKLKAIERGTANVPASVGDDGAVPQQRQIVRLPPNRATSHTPTAPVVINTAPAPAPPIIPILNLGKVTQEGLLVEGGHLVSQSARPEGTHGSSPKGRPELMSQTARPDMVSGNGSQGGQNAHTCTDYIPDPSPGAAPTSLSGQDGSSPHGKRVPSAPLRGLTSAGPHSGSPPSRAEPGHMEELNVVANGLNSAALPSVDAERPVTRRSKSRAGRPGTGTAEYEYDGPGMGKIPSSEHVRPDGNGAAVSPRADVSPAPIQPHAPKGPQRSVGSASGRRGRHVTGSGAVSGGTLGEHSAKPPSKPTSRGAYGTGRPNPYAPQVQAQNEGISGRTIRPSQLRKGDGSAMDAPHVTAPSPSKPAPSKPYAREMALRNKQAAQHGNIQLSHDSNPTGGKSLIV